MINRNGNLVQFTNSFIKNITQWDKDNYSLNSRNVLMYSKLNHQNSRAIYILIITNQKPSTEQHSQFTTYTQAYDS